MLTLQLRDFTLDSYFHGEHRIVERTRLASHILKVFCEIWLRFGYFEQMPYQLLRTHLSDPLRDKYHTHMSHIVYVYLGRKHRFRLPQCLRICQTLPETPPDLRPLFTRCWFSREWSLKTQDC